MSVRTPEISRNVSTRNRGWTAERDAWLIIEPFSITGRRLRSPEPQWASTSAATSERGVRDHERNRADWFRAVRSTTPIRAVPCPPAHEPSKRPAQRLPERTVQRAERNALWIAQRYVRESGDRQDFLYVLIGVHGSEEVFHTTTSEPRCRSGQLGCARRPRNRAFCILGGTPICYAGGSGVRVLRRKTFAEQRLALAVEAARLGSWTWDMASGTTTWDERLEEMHGLPPGGFGGTFEDWVAAFTPTIGRRASPACRRRWRIRRRTCCCTGTTWPDGSVHMIECRGTVLVDSDGSADRDDGRRDRRDRPGRARADVAAVAVADGAAHVPGSTVAARVSRGRGDADRRRLVCGDRACPMADGRRDR